MQNRFASHRSRTAAAVLTVLPVIAAAALTGCDAGQDATTKGDGRREAPLLRCAAPVWDRSPDVGRRRRATPSPGGSTPVRC